MNPKIMVLAGAAMALSAAAAVSAKPAHVPFIEPAYRRPRARFGTLSSKAKPESGLKALKRAKVRLR